MEALILAVFVGATILAISWNQRDAYGMLCVLGSCVSVVLLGLLVVFVLTHDGNHSSLEPWLLAIVFLPTALLGGRALYCSGLRWSAALAILSGLSGLAYLWFIDVTNRMIPYQTWIWRGMP